MVAAAGTRLFAGDREALKIAPRWFASDFSCFHLASEIGPASTSNSRQNRDSSAFSITMARFAGNSGGERARPTALDFAATDIAERQSWGEMILPPGPGGRVPSTRMIRNRNCFVCQSFVQPWRTSASGSLGQLESAIKNQPINPHRFALDGCHNLPPVVGAGLGVNQHAEQFGRVLLEADF
jgi:hypothetical protein